ncbi:MAG: LexA family transcriptional regulator [Rhizobiales bacterium]|nr:LexA family transcriptional regulator [Hyphomicrobiales bacterium]OJY06659.1 MAG: phage repressor [Rhizobiales bacterium 63-22]
MKNRIREIRESLGLSQTELGERVGAHWQTVHRAETGKVNLTDDKLDIYARALGVSRAALIDNDSARMVTVKGYIQAGMWAETWEWPLEDQYEVPVLDDPALHNFSLHAAETRGPSMNKRYPEGTVLVFTDAMERPEDLVPGKRYLIERERADGLREATVKKLWQDEHGALWLVPESDDPRFQEAIALDGSDGDTIRILGRVKYAVTRE